jgi:hypothetical protein
LICALGFIPQIRQFNQRIPAKNTGVNCGKHFRHLLDCHIHTDIVFGSVTLKNYAEFLAVFETVDDGLGTHLQAPLIKQYKYYMPKIDLLSTKKMLQLNNIHFLDFKEAIGILFYASQTIASGAIKISISPNYLAGEVVTVFHDQEKNFHFWLLFCYAMSIL